LQASHQSIALHIVKPIRVKLTGYHSVIQVPWTTVLDNSGYVIRETTTHLPEYIADLASANQNVADVFVLCHDKLQLLANALKRMAKHPMPHVMDERRR